MDVYRTCYDDSTALARTYFTKLGRRICVHELKSLKFRSSIVHILESQDNIVTTSFISLMPLMDDKKIHMRIPCNAANDIT